MIFDYPNQRLERRHGPSGYTAYESYRPWLRDEFDFRCVYCLKREVWGQVTSEFDLDHFVPQSINALMPLDYLNLVYACRRCNSVKRDQAVSNPCELLCAESVVTLSDGSLHTEAVESQRLIRQLDLNSPRLKKWRVMWMRIVCLAEDRDARLFHQLVGPPTDLPDLSRLKPPLNNRREGITQSWFARQLSGEVPHSA